MFELNAKSIYIHVYDSSMKKGCASGGTDPPLSLTNCTVPDKPHVPTDVPANNNPLLM